MSDMNTISEPMKAGIVPNTSSSDALVFFGATGDLAHKKIFSALQSLAKRGNLDFPANGVAKAGWTLDQLKSRARDSGQARKRVLDQSPIDTTDRVCFASVRTRRSRWIDNERDHRLAQAIACSYYAADFSDVFRNAHAV
jgi:glucose-6-phosphate 1-dehydrogenase